MTKHYRVIFDMDHVEWIPPSGVLGGVMGDIDRGQLAVYKVPEEVEQEFLYALHSCTTVIEFAPVKKGVTQ